MSKAKNPPIPQKKLKYLPPDIDGKRMKVVHNMMRWQSELDSLLVPIILACGEASCCLLPETRILLSDSSTKSIEAINVDDKIYSYNFLSDCIEENRVVGIDCIQNNQGFVTINGVLKITEKHPLWVNNASWVEAGIVRIGDILLNGSGREVMVESIRKTPGTHKVYNLHVGGKNKNYFADGILVSDYYSDLIQISSPSFLVTPFSTF